MCPFIETIQIVDGEVKRLSYHNKRMNATREHFYPHTSPLDLSDYLVTRHEKGILKCRVVYTDCIHEISYSPYTMRNIQSLRLVDDDQINYEYKSTDRSKLNELFARRGSEDDVLIVRNGEITDTSFSNIAFFDGNNWITPSHPLLKGTQRAALIEQGILQERSIYVRDIESYQQVCIINAMIDLGKLIIPISRIIR